MTDLIAPPPLAIEYPPFRLGAYEFRDSRFILRPDYGKVKQLLADAWRELPPEIHCRVEATTDETLELIRVGGGSDAVAEFLAIEAQRVSEQEMLGTTIFPLRFAVYDQDQEVVGAFEWYAINELSRSRTEVSLSAMPFPAFANLAETIEEQMKLTADVCEIFLSSRGLDVNGVLHRFTQVNTFTFVKTGRGSPGDAETAAWDAEIDGRADDSRSPIQVSKSVNGWGRELRVITWVP